MTTQEIADRLVALCRQGKFEDVQKELHAKDVVCLEPYGTAVFPRETKGLDALLNKGRQFTAMIEQVHALTVSDPLVAGNAFVCAMHFDVTLKGRGRTVLDELSLYQTKDGKIISEQFTARFDV